MIRRLFFNKKTAFFLGLSFFMTFAILFFSILAFKQSNTNKINNLILNNIINSFFYDFTFEKNNYNFFNINFTENTSNIYHLTDEEIRYLKILYEKNTSLPKIIVFNNNLIFTKQITNTQFVCLKVTSKKLEEKLKEFNIIVTSNPLLKITYTGNNNITLTFNVEYSSENILQAILYSAIISIFIFLVIIWLTLLFNKITIKNAIDLILFKLGNILNSDISHLKDLKSPYEILGNLTNIIYNKINSLTETLNISKNIGKNDYYILTTSNFIIKDFSNNIFHLFASQFNIELSQGKSLIENFYKLDKNLIALEQVHFNQYIEFYIFGNQKYYQIIIYKLENNDFLITLTDASSQILQIIKYGKLKEVLNKIYNTTNNFYVIVDTKLRIYKYSPNFTEILDRTNENIENKFFIEFIKSTNINLFNNYISKSICKIDQQITESITLPLVTKSRKIIDFEILLKDKITYFGNVYYLIIGRNIIEKKKIESQFSLLQTALDTSSIPIIITDANSIDNPIIYVNKSFEELTGYSAEEVLNKNPRFLYKDDKYQENLEVIRRAINNVVYCKTIVRNYKKDGTLFWNEVQISPIFDINGNLSNYIAYIKDITQEIIMQQQLLEAKEKAEAGMKSRAEFLTIMSHEIKTPLNGIIGILNILENSKLNNDQINLINIIKKNSSNLLTILNNILQYTNLISHKITLKNSKVSIQKVLNDIFNIIFSQVKQKNIDLYTYIDPRIDYQVNIDYDKFKDLLNQILSNAVKFTDTGFIGFYATEINRTEAFVTLKFMIIDTGIGISEENLPRIFDPFYQVDSSNKRKYGGIGIGLSIAKEIANLFNASLWVESTLGVGTTFNLTLQLPYFIDASSQSANLDNFNEIKQKSCLLVTDNNQLEKYYSTAISDLFSVFQTLDYTTFLENPIPDFNFLIIDISKDIALLQQKDLSNFETKILIISKSLSNNSAVQVLSKNNCQILYKPFVCKAFYNLLLPKKETNEEVNISNSNKNNVKILVAEDNKLNQKVAQFIFNKLGFNIDLANDGFETVLKAKENNYDIIFMDLQMPEMDGFEATKAILTDKTIKQKPIIIAMTANTLEDDKIKCIEAGMVDFITKPINPDNLLEIINMYSFNNKSMQNNTDKTPTKTEQNTVSPNDTQINNSENANEILEPKYLDMNVFNSTFNIETDKEFAIEMLNLFLIQSDQSLISMKKAFEEKNYEQIRSLAHQLKGSSGNLGAMEFHNVCAAIDKEVKQNILENIENHLKSLEYIHIKTSDAIKNFLETLKK